MRLNSTSAEPMAVIRVPATPKSAYNPKRPAGTLLQSQLKHLEWAVRPAGERTAKSFRVKPAYTEAEVSARIAALNQQLHEQATAPRGVMPPNPTAPPQTAAAPAAKPRRTSKRKAASKSTSKPKLKTQKRTKSRAPRASRLPPRR
jgi:hypothetical protein